MKQTLHILTEARALIEKPENWTKGAYARDANGRPDLSKSRSAVCWCAFGAVSRVGGNFEQAEKAFGWDEGFNDSHQHAEVIAAFDKAIEAERAKAEASLS